MGDIVVSNFLNSTSFNLALIIAYWFVANLPIAIAAKVFASRIGFNKRKFFNLFFIFGPFFGFIILSIQANK